MSKLTPGPWALDCAEEDAYYRCIMAQQKIVARVMLRGIMGNKLDYAEANARLIAAAPEIYDALRDVFEYLDAIPESAAGGDDEAVNLARKCRAAIAKADGK
jgi:hypothetical protein